MSKTEKWPKEIGNKFGGTEDRARNDGGKKNELNLK